MQKIVYLPQVELNLESATVLDIHVEEGEFVEIDQVILEVETQKATVDVPSSESGYLRKILVATDDEITFNDPLAILTDKPDEPFEVPIPQGESGEKGNKEALSADVGPGEPVYQEEIKEIRAVPAARKLARKMGLELHQIQGSGPRGRITVKDVEAQASSVEREGTKDGGEWVSLPPSRKTLVKQMERSLAQIPQIYISRNIDVSPLFEKKEGAGFTPRLIEAIGKALVHHPKLRTSIDGYKTRVEPVSVAIALNTTHGLVAPVIRNTDQLSSEEIATRLSELHSRAEKNRLGLDEITNGPFALSNLGKYHVDHFTPFVFHGQTAVLAVGQAKTENSGGKITAWFTLGADHRVVDGVDAALFLETLQKEINNSCLGTNETP